MTAPESKRVTAKNGENGTWQPRADNKLGEIVIRTHLPYSGDEGRDTLSRNHINALTAELLSFRVAQAHFLNCS